MSPHKEQSEAAAAPVTTAFLPRSWIGLCVLAAMIATEPGTAWAQAGPEDPFPKRVKSVELEGGVEWLNAPGPISLKDLRGKVVLLDFWTFCCINCIHVLPDLDYLEKKFEKELVVIGVHSAKFDNEKETNNIRKAIQRYEIAHPVVNDANMILWTKFGVRSWPTLVLIDPEGYYCGFVSGEGNRDLLETVITKLIAFHKAKGTLDETPLKFDLERQRMPATPLRFPGKILADPANNRLFISDSNHNRIVITTLEGQLLDVIGTGAIGRKDGPYAAAEFDHPQGMALVGETLYVADTENHLLRTIDLNSKTVQTLSGTGVQANFRATGGPLKTSPLNSPWDLLVLDNVLYIAMAGPHQLWSHRLGSDTIQPYAGSGREDIRNGPLAEAALAQPSGLATDGKAIYVCDSEGSSIRKITTTPNNDLANPKGEVTTVVGASNLPNARSLFEFGDTDGVGGAVRFQHPLGIVFHDGGLYVADSYNHKIKRIELKNRSAKTWLGTGKPGTATDPTQLAEPAGLTIANGQLYIADTNNHRILKTDLVTKATTVLDVKGLTPPAPVSQSSLADPSVVATTVNEQSLAEGDRVQLTIQVTLPEEFKLNPRAPQIVQVQAMGEQTLFAAETLRGRQELTVDGDKLTISLPTVSKAGTATLEITALYNYCRGGSSGVCKLGTARWTVPVRLSAAGQSDTVNLSAAVPTTPANGTPPAAP